MERLEQKLAQCPKDQRLDYARQIGKAELDLAKLRRKANNEHVR